MDSQKALATMARLQQEMTDKGDFPTISAAAKDIAAALRDNDASASFDLAQAVLSDFALTQKVIRLANSAMYSAIGGSVSTVSRAIYVLGTETVAHLALGQKFIEQVDRAASGGKAREEMVKAVLAGSVARNVTSSLPSRDSEESVVCALIHDLGRLLVSFYLPAEWHVICNRVKGLHGGSPVPEAEAAQAVLGLGLHEIGRQVAVGWGLPAELTNTMRPLEHSGDKALDHSQWLTAVAAFSSDCAGVLADKTATAESLLAHAENYGAALGMEPAELCRVADAVKKDEECIRLLSGKGREFAPNSKPQDSYTRLTQGLLDLQAIARSGDISAMTGVILEAMQSGLGFRRTYIFLRNGTNRRLSARLSLGAGARELMPSLSFGEAFEPDVFHLALAQKQPILVDNCQAPGWRSKLPDWYKQALPHTSACLCIPLVVGNIPVALLYGDWERPANGPWIEEHEMGKLLQMAKLMVSTVMQNSK